MSDFYIFFTPMIRRVKPEAFRLMLNATYCEASLSMLLNIKQTIRDVALMQRPTVNEDTVMKRNSEIISDQTLPRSSVLERRVYYLVPREVGQLFGLWVGGEFSNSAATIHRLLTKQEENEITIPPHLCERWRDTEPEAERKYTREQKQQLMGQSLLSALTFYHFGKQEGS